MKSLAQYTSILAFGLLAVVGCGKDDDAKTQPIEQQPAITDVRTIADTADKRTLIGRKVEIDNAITQEIVGNYVFWAGETRYSAVPVVRQDKIKGGATSPVRVGAVARISGTIRFVESVSAADPMWDKVSEKEKRDIESAKIYIDAERVLGTD